MRVEDLVKRFTAMDPSEQGAFIQNLRRSRDLAMENNPQPKRRAAAKKTDKQIAGLGNLTQTQLQQLLEALG